MNPDLPARFRDAFFKTLRADDSAESLRQSALASRLGEWTRALTTAAVHTCQRMGWPASGRANELNLLPVQRSEYLALDVMAFADGEKRWRYPKAVIELENSPNLDFIAYALWKVLAVRADLRLVFCYRRSPELATALVKHLREEVIGAMGLTGRVALDGDTVLVIGSRSESTTFPDGFFNWWLLNTNTGYFEKF
jgi:hypothetical protein